MNIIDRLFRAKKQCDDISLQIEYLKASYMLVAEKLGICWYYADKDGYTKDCGRHTLDLYKLTKEAVVIVKWMDFVFPDDLSNVLTHWRYSVAMKKAFELKFRTYIGNGELIKIHSKAVRVGDDYFGEITLL